MIERLIYKAIETGLDHFRNEPSLVDALFDDLMQLPPEEIKEIKAICHCGKKATMNARIDSSGRMETEGNQIEIGGNERYVSLCRSCFSKADTGPSSG